MLSLICTYLALIAVQQVSEESIEMSADLGTLPPTAELELAAIDLGSDGSDGVFRPLSSITVDLGLAVPGSWDMNNSADAGKGVYDADKWVVVFKYSSVDIHSGVTVTFKNHPSRAPVVWLVQDNVLINGLVSLNGANGHESNQTRILAESGPGGFRGGRGADAATRGSGGRGPGGATLGDDDSGGSGGSYGSIGGTGSSGGGSPKQPYGNVATFPLIGGSGGSGGTGWGGGCGGGGGGGVILIAANTSINVNGFIRASGGKAGGNRSANVGQREGGGGSGGSIRLIANAINGSGKLEALAGPQGDACCDNLNGAGGGVGRIRVEANTITLADIGNPAYNFSLPNALPLWPNDDIPGVAVIAAGGLLVSSDPSSTLTNPGVEAVLPAAGSTQVLVQGKNIPCDGSWTVKVRLVPLSGHEQVQLATCVSMDADGTSVWSANINFPSGFATLQAMATTP